MDFIKVKFEVEIPPFTPQNSQIYIAGNFNGWNPGDPKFILKEEDKNRYTITLEFPAGEKIEYKITRGSWDYVEKGERGEEIPNRSLKAFKDTTVKIKVYNWRDFVETIKTKKHTIAGNVRTFTLPSRYLKYYNPRKIWVYLPPDYDTSGKNYPVLYMHDGQNLFDEAESFAGEWRVDETLELMHKESNFGLIVVGVENAKEHRMDEYSPFFNQQYKHGGEADLYLKFIVEELKPYIDSTYRTLKDDAALLGSSLGGLISIYAGFKYPETFKKVGSMSGAFWFNPEIVELIKSAKKAPEKIYIDYGKRESEDPLKYVEQNEKVIKTIKGKKSLKIENILVVVDEEGIHHESAWGRRLKSAIEFLFKN
ncbi:MAG: alpha/beta hydrolase-fold protein [bacterium]|nr:alpha/beta hydrolase-fold protein [bacterium]